MCKTQPDHYNDTSEKTNCFDLVNSCGRPKNWSVAVMEAWRLLPREAIYLDNSQDIWVW